MISNWWGRSFLKHCRRELRSHVSDPAAVVTRIRDHAERVYQKSAENEPNKKTRAVYAYCSLVLAAFREIRSETGDEPQAFHVARTAFHKTCAPAWRVIMKLFVWFVPDPVAYFQRNSPAKSGQKQLGPTMEFDEEYAEGNVDLVVRRCGFNQFFVDHGEPSLTPVLCVFDHYWMKALDRSRRPVRTERPSTISLGGDCCRFRLIRDADKQDSQPSDIVLVALENPPYTHSSSSPGNAK